MSSMLHKVGLSMLVNSAVSPIVFNDVYFQISMQVVMDYIKRVMLGLDMFVYLEVCPIVFNNA